MPGAGSGGGRVAHSSTRPARRHPRAVLMIDAAGSYGPGSVTGEAGWLLADLADLAKVSTRKTRFQASRVALADAVSARLGVDAASLLPEISDRRVAGRAVAMRELATVLLGRRKRAGRACVSFLLGFGSKARARRRARGRSDEGNAWPTVRARRRDVSHAQDEHTCSASIVLQSVEVDASVQHRSRVQHGGITLPLVHRRRGS